MAVFCVEAIGGFVLFQRDGPRARLCVGVGEVFLTGHVCVATIVGMVGGSQLHVGARFLHGLGLHAYHYKREPLREFRFSVFLPSQGLFVFSYV